MYIYCTGFIQSKKEQINREREIDLLKEKKGYNGLRFWKKGEIWMKICI